MGQRPSESILHRFACRFRPTCHGRCNSAQNDVAVAVDPLDLGYAILTGRCHISKTRDQPQIVSPPALPTARAVVGAAGGDGVEVVAKGREGEAARAPDPSFGPDDAPRCGELRIGESQFDLLAVR